MTKDDAIEKALTTICEIYSDMPDGERCEFLEELVEEINKL